MLKNTIFTEGFFLVTIPEKWNSRRLIQDLATSVEGWEIPALIRMCIGR